MPKKPCLKNVGFFATELFVLEARLAKIYLTSEDAGVSMK